MTTISVLRTMVPGAAPGAGEGGPSSSASADALRSQLRDHFRALPPSASSDRPCDRCRARRKHCSRGQPCRRCARSSVACTYQTFTHRSGPLSRDERRALASAGVAPRTVGKSPPQALQAPKLRTVGVSQSPGLQQEPPTWGIGPGAHHLRAASECDFSDTASVSSSATFSSASHLSEPAPGPSPEDAYAGLAAGVTDELREQVSRWVSQHARLHVVPAGAIEWRLPDWLTTHGFDSSTKLEETTQVPDTASTVPALFRRFPQRPGAVEALQRGEPITITDEAPDCPCWHPPPQPPVPRPLKIGESVLRANPRGLYVLYIDEDGMVQAREPADCASDSRTLFQTRWRCVRADGTVTSPPWEAFERSGSGGSGGSGGDEACDSLWPAGSTIAEDEYTSLMERAHAVLAHEPTSTLIESELAVRQTFHVTYHRTLSAYLSAVMDSAHPRGWTRTQTRTRQALLLAMAAAVPQVSGALSAEIANAAAAAAGIPPRVASLSAWEFAAGAIQLAWRLLQPRAGGRWDYGRGVKREGGRDGRGEEGEGAEEEPELTLDALVAVSFLVQAMRQHPLFAEMQQAAMRLTAAPETHAAILREVKDSPERQETYRRLIAHHLLEVTAVRFWRQKDLPIRFGARFLELGGDISLFPGEVFVDQSDGTETTTRHRLRFVRYNARLALLNEQILDSSLLADSPSADLAHRLADARRILTDLRAWREEAFDYKLAEGDAKPYDRADAEARWGKWHFLLDPAAFAEHQTDKLFDSLVVTIDLVVAALHGAAAAAGASPSAPMGHDVDAAAQDVQDLHLGLNGSGNSDVKGCSSAAARAAAAASAEADAAALADVLAQYAALRATIQPATKPLPPTRASSWLLASGACQEMTRMHGHSARLAVHQQLSPPPGS